jgi:hypothetical protein
LVALYMASSLRGFAAFVIGLAGFVTRSEFQSIPHLSRM